MLYGSVCSGIEAASVAWEPLGWRASFFAEIEKFPSRVLAHRWPGVPNLGDMLGINARTGGGIDLLVGGTPCQSFSVIGLRGGLSDPRGNLALGFCRLADQLRPKWILWENVAGVLSSNDGKDFGTFLGALGELGYGFSYRVLDAQYFGVAQQRRRVFVVGHLGDWQPSAAVLFESSRVLGDLASGDQKETGTKRNRARRFGVVSTLLRKYGNLSVLDAAGGLYPLDRLDGFLRPRRLTPIECERLQGFPDDYTAIPNATDAARYAALGNSMAVPVMHWIGARIDYVDRVLALAA